MTVRQTPIAPIQFGPTYEAEKMRRLSDQLRAIAAALNVLQGMLAGGDKSQVLAKTTNRSLDAHWSDALSAVESDGTGVSLIESFEDGVITLKSLVEGAGISITDNGDSITIAGEGSSGGAPADLTYLTLLNSSIALENSRFLRVDTSVLTMHDAGEGGALTIGILGNSIGGAQLQNLGSHGTFSIVQVDDSGRVTDGGQVQASDVGGLAAFVSMFAGGYPPQLGYAGI